MHFDSIFILEMLVFVDDYSVKGLIQFRWADVIFILCQSSDLRKENKFVDEHIKRTQMDFNRNFVLKWIF